MEKEIMPYDKEARHASRLERIIKYIRSHIRVPYYYVRPCPVCGSEMTGRIMRSSNSTTELWQRIEALKSGELIRHTPVKTKDNTFCLSCNFEWAGRIPLRFITMEEREKEKEKRMTKYILAYAMEEDRKNKDGLSGPFKSARKFLGRL